MERLDGQVREELDRLGPQGGMPAVVDAWASAVGPQIAANAWPARIARDGTLHVNASSSTWAFELSQLAPTLLDRLREALGENAPKALRFAAGHVPEPAAPPAGESPPSPVVPTREALQRAAELAAEIGDEVLRERVARAAAIGLSRGRSDSPV